jgi:hypothetical protein
MKAVILVLVAILTLGLIFTIGACQQPESAAEDFPNLKPPVLKTNLKGPTWILDAVSTGSQYEDVSDSSLRVVFLDSGIVQLNACNACNANYSILGDSLIHFSPAVCTRMGCLSDALVRGDALIQWMTEQPVFYRFTSSGVSLRRDSTEFHFYDSAR